MRKPLEFDLKQVEGLAAQGLTEGQIAQALGICQDTLTNHKKRNSEFSDAIKRGKAKGIGVVTNKLMEQIKSGNTTAMLFYLKCQAGWKETDVREITGPNGGEIQHSVKWTVQPVKPADQV